MAEEKVKQKKPHSMILENRNFLSLSGVLDVGSFDEQSVVIYTENRPAGGLLTKLFR